MILAERHRHTNGQFGGESSLYCANIYPSLVRMNELLIAESGLFNTCEAPRRKTFPDQYPVLSEPREAADELNFYDTLALDRDEANLVMIDYYASFQALMNRTYRHFYVVTTDPEAACVQRWKDEVQSIGCVMTPQQCVDELCKKGQESKIDFHERDFSPKSQEELDALSD